MPCTGARGSGGSNLCGGRCCALGAGDGCARAREGLAGGAVPAAGRDPAEPLALFVLCCSQVRGAMQAVPVRAARPGGTTLQMDIARALECSNKVGAIKIRVIEDTRFFQTEARCIAASSQCFLLISPCPETFLKTSSLEKEN